MRDYAVLVKGGFRIQLYRCSGYLLQERKSKLTTASPQGPLKNTPFTDKADRDRAFEQRVRDLEAEGWIDQNPERSGSTKPRKPSTEALEKAFAALVAKTIAALETARDGADDKVWRSAIAAYGKLKVRAGGDRTENLVHFFAVDGIALDQRHPVVVTKVRASKARKARWLELLESAR